MGLYIQKTLIHFQSCDICQRTTPKGTTSIVPLSEIPIKGELITLIPVSLLVCIQHSEIFIRIASELKEIKQAKEVKHTSAMLHVYCSQQFALKNVPK